LTGLLGAGQVWLAANASGKLLHPSELP